MSHSDLILPDDYDPVGHLIDPGQMIVWQGQLDSLEETLRHIYDRAKYHDESLTKTDFLEMIEDLQARVSSLRKTGRTP